MRASMTVPAWFTRMQRHLDAKELGSGMIQRHKRRHDAWPSTHRLERPSSDRDLYRESRWVMLQASGYREYSPSASEI